MTFSNLRQNPFSGAYSYRLIVDELNLCTEFNFLPGLFGFILADRPNPDLGTITVIEDDSGAVALELISSGNPTVTQARIDHSRGIVLLHMLNDGKNFLTTYQGAGTNATLENIQSMTSGVPLWDTLVYYQLNQVINFDNNLYTCKVSHTSGIFLTDYIAGKWKLINEKIPPLTASSVPLLATQFGLNFDSNKCPIKFVTVGTNPHGAAFDGSFLWVTNSGSGDVSKIDVSTNAVVATVVAGTQPYGAAFDGNYIWVTNYGSANVSKIDILTNAIVATVAVGTQPHGVAFDGSYLWIVNSGSNNVSKIDISTNAVVATVAVGTQPTTVAFDGSYLWVVNFSLNNVSKVNISTNAVIANVTVGTQPHGAAFDGSYLWVTNYGSANVSKIDILTDTVVATVAVGTQPYGAAFDCSYVWVVNSGSNNVSKIDILTNDVVATVAVGTQPTIAVFDGNFLWVVNYGLNNVIKLYVRG